MGALHRLVDLLRKLDPENSYWRELQRRRALIETEKAFRIGDKEERRHRLEDINEVFESNTSDYGRKLYLIENCIYGVDIQPIACQIAKLRFFISLIVDQKVEPTERNLGVRPLPNLEAKIVSADTLIPIERPKDHQLGLLDTHIAPLRQQLEAIRHDYFIARTPATKAKCRQRDAELRRQIGDVLCQGGFPAETARAMADWDPYDQNAHAKFFDPEWMFGLPVGKVRLTEQSSATLRGNFAFTNETSGEMELVAPDVNQVESGFDIVIGNPPYVRQEQIKHLKPLLKSYYDCFTGMADLYVYFYERAIRLLKVGGVFSFITSNKWLRSAYGERLRTWLTKNARILQLIDFGDAPVFAAIIYPCIVILQRIELGSLVGTHEIQALSWKPGVPVEQFAEIFWHQKFSLPQAELKSDSWWIEGQGTRRLLERIRTKGTSLGEYCQGRLYRGILTGLNEAFVVDRATRDRLVTEHPSSVEVLKPFLRGRDVKRWRIEFAEQYLIKIESSENKQHPWSGQKKKEAEAIFSRTYPAIHSRLQCFRDGLIKRYDQGQYFWELRSCDYWDEFLQPKIIIPAISDTVNYAADWEGYFSNDKTSICIPPSIPFALAVANSRVSWWLTQQLYASRQGGFYEFKPMYVSQLPIPNANTAQQGSISNLLEYIIWLNQQPDIANEPTSNPRDTLMLGYFEQIINGLVYELFFAEELHAVRLHPFTLVEQARLPKLDEIPEKNRLAVLRETFERLYDTNHPLRGCLHDLGSLETVRIIEGRE
jgi:hypothetical protein